MKKLIAPMLLLIGMVVFCIWSTWRIDQLCGDCISHLERAEVRYAAGDFSAAAEHVRQSKTIWDSHEGFFGMALRHTESDDIGILYPPLLEICRQKDADEFYKANLELIATLRHLSRAELPYYFNIL